ncbi:host-nuclease inhibitor Gam family protein [Treponema endosymbiont of Eucomonympha sp.]|uniref:host-nuclease inhibitor Gam family protein n=1 Tax=Treponema endosymbiont of Eucomonympha sp. TaxID=1580831 RepID=UPI00075098CB|nr:host-nuclease inhibitor Gam family protein [Treponema endosymbiont of Eucomonympha sp.]
MKEIKTIAAAEKALRRIAEIDRDVDRVNGAAMKLVERAKASALLELEGKETERQKLLELLEQFSDSKRAEIYADGKKSLDLANGVIGYRQQPNSIEVSNDTAALLEAAGLSAFVKVEKTPVKSARKNLSAEELAKYGATLKEGKEVFYAKASDKCLGESGAASAA